MTTFLAGIVSLLPGILTGWLLGTVTGWFMHRDDYCRHPSAAVAPCSPVPTAASAERVDPPPAPVVNVYVTAPGLPWSQQAYQVPARTFPELEGWTS